MNKNIFDFRDKVVFITGGTGHIGKSIVNAFCERGATVIVNSRNKKKNLDFIENLNSKGFNAKSCIFDLSDYSSRDDALEKINLNRVDVLINNAYSGSSGSVISSSDKDYLDSYIQTVVASQNLFKKLLPKIKMGVKKNSDASVINIASMYGLVAPHVDIYEKNQENPPFYGAAKAALLQWTRYAAVEFANYGIRFNSISPGAFPSESAQKKNPVLMTKLIDLVPMRRFGKPEDLTTSILFLSSPHSNYVTGSNINVDGGWTSW
tara:strand:- start:978 stop:1769 length:792 start_codon:yes stop_codon:yes gene_type:complete